MRPEDLENVIHSLFPVAITITKKHYGPYIRNGKQYWRNYHREIKRKDAKTFLEIHYISLPMVFIPLFNEKEERKEPSE